MDIKCFAQGCDIPPSLCCYCSLKAITLCSNHIPGHIQKYPNLVHNYRSIYKIIIPDVKEQIIKSFQSKLDVLKNETQSFNAFINNIFLNVQKVAKDYYAKNKLMKDICKKLLKEVDENNVASMIFRRDLDDINQVCFENIENEIQRRFELINTENENSFEKLIENLIDESIQLKSYLNNSICVKSDRSTINNTCVYTFQQNTKVVVNLDTNNLQKSSETIGLNKIQGGNAAICCVPGNKLFVSGGFNGSSFLSETFLVDLTSKK